jgi:diguanylate cyclase (GGDEF)-like protein/PAS domain S-box-containing protein
MTEQLRILMVEDVPADAELILNQLQRAGIGSSARRVDAETDFRRELAEFRPDVVLVDFTMPKFDGMTALAIARECAPDVPFIFVSGTIGEEHAIRALKSGATDYVLKNNLLRLATAVQRAIQEAGERAARRKAETELETLRQRLQNIVSTLPDVVWSVAFPSRQVLYISPAVTTVFGLTQRQIHEEHVLWGDFIHPDDRPRVLGEWDEATQDKPFESEYRIVTATGDIRWIHSRGRHVRDDGGKVIRLDGISRDLTEWRKQQQKIDYLAHYDVLTGLPNRPLFHERLTQMLHAARNAHAQVAVALGDIRRFRLINETFGRQAGDALLREFAQRIKALWPGPENVARISADCFAGILTDVKEPAGLAYSFEKTVTAALGAPFVVEGNEFKIAITAGMAVFPVDGEDADTLLRNAEAALKKAKVSGERYLFYRPEMNSRVAEALLLENKLRRAIEQEQFILHYQPKVHGSNRRIAGLEALIRWRDPDAGLMSPDKFIPVLEDTGMILDVGRWAIRKALAAYREWHMKGLQTPRIAVNVSAIQLRQKDFVDVVRNLVKDSVAGSHGLDFEITESLLMEDIEGSIEKLRAIRNMGVNISIDDFGTGYSSLRYLTKLPVNALKIDRSFIATMAHEPDSMTIVSAIVSLAHSLNLKVVAEGVESEAQSQLLKLLNCDEMQGYLFGKPLPADRVEDFLKSVKGSGA